MDGLSESIQQQERKVVRMLKGGRQPSDIARITGLSQIWIETKARTFGIRPLTVEGVKDAK
jgi:uncharacterized protein YerC